MTMVEKSLEQARAATRVAMMGYGLEAREHALRLRAAGWHVSVVVRPGGMSWIRAMADGFRPSLAREALAEADVVAVELPEAEQPAVWAYTIAPILAPGALVVFSHGAALYSGALEPDPRLDVVLVTTGETADACRVAVHQDATGRALERAAAFARAVYDGAKVGTTTLATEVKTELSELVDRLGGMPALLAEWEHVLANPGHEPDEATLHYYEQLRATVLAESGPMLATPPVSRPDLSRKRGAA
jgi:ketol-acid reductoisomerase